MVVELRRGFLASWSPLGVCYDTGSGSPVRVSQLLPDRRPPPRPCSGMRLGCLDFAVSTPGQPTVDWLRGPLATPWVKGPSGSQGITLAADPLGLGPWSPHSSLLVPMA